MSDQTTSSRPSFTPDAADRPLSPHLQVWRWSVTMAASISHRATGIALYAGAFLLTLWLLSGAVSDGFYNAVTAFLGSWFGLLILFGFTWAQMFHLCNGIKYLIWDTGHLLRRDVAKTTVWVVYAASIVLTAIIWIVGFSLAG